MTTVVVKLGRCQPKQHQFMMAHTRYVAYGGARGGGKSWALKEKCKRLALKWPGIRILIIRKNLDDLRQNHITPLRSELPEQVARYRELDKTFYFANGSTIKCAYFKTDHDADKYQGQEYDIIAIDEATQLLEHAFVIFKACLRGTNSFPRRMYLTCNPGGVGHSWFKRLFIDREFKENENPDDYMFIQANIDDNAKLREADPEYVKQLESLPEDLREMWRYGKWDVVVGQYFNEFRRDKHVIEPIPIPNHWRRYRAIDYGLDALACVWGAVSPDGDLYIYREEQKADSPIWESAKLILRDTPPEENIYLTLAPPDVWGRSQETGQRKADLFREAGLTLTRSSNDREAGWLAIKELLNIRSNGQPRMHIFDTCPLLIRNLPLLTRDKLRPTDCDTEPHEITHLPDALRYLVVWWLSPGMVPHEALPRGWSQSMIDDYKRESEAGKAKMRALFGNKS